jgi:hypothetical protein
LASRDAQFKLGTAACAGLGVQAATERGRVCPHVAYAEAGSITFSHTAAVVADAQEERAPMLDQHDVDSAGGPVQGSIDDRLTGDSDEMLTLGGVRFTVWARVRLDSDFDLQVEPMAEFVSHHAKRGFRARSRGRRKVGDHAARDGDCLTNGEHQRMLGSELAVQALALYRDAGEILGQTIMQVVGDPVAL